MKTLLAALSVILAVNSGTAIAAEWVLVGNNSAITSYVDKASIQKKGSNVTSWWLNDFQTALSFGGKQILSAKVRKEFNCKKKEIRTLLETGYTGRMGEGTPVYTIDGAKPWQVAIPYSIGEKQLLYACPKKQ